jgi:hypothetical protein
MVWAPFAATQASIAPLSHAWCWVCQLWSVPGTAWADVVVVSMWNGSR